MENKTTIIAKEIKALKVSNKDLMEVVAKMQREGATKKEIKKHINSEFAKTLKEAKGVKDIIGKTFVVKKDGTLGTNVFTSETSQVEEDQVNEYNQLKALFGEMITKTNLISNTLHIGRNVLTVDGAPVEECTVPEDSNYTYAKEDHLVKKYALKLNESVEFNIFVEGGAMNLINVLKNDLYNQFTKHSLLSDVVGQRGLFNVGGTRKLVRKEANALGLITPDEILDMRLANNKVNLTTGVYLMPLQMYAKIEKLKDEAGSYIFMAINAVNGKTFENFQLVGTLAGRPVAVVSDDIWFKNGENAESNDAVLIAYVSGKAFQYYSSTMSSWTNLHQSFLNEGDIIIEVKQAEETGCIDLHAMMFKGFGMLDPKSGNLFVNEPFIAPLNTFTVEQNLEQGNDLEANTTKELKKYAEIKGLEFKQKDSKKTMKKIIEEDKKEQEQE